MFFNFFFFRNNLLMPTLAFFKNIYAKYWNIMLFDDNNDNGRYIVLFNTGAHWVSTIRGFITLDEYIKNNNQSVIQNNISLTNGMSMFNHTIDTFIDFWNSQLLETQKTDIGIIYSTMMIGHDYCHSYYHHFEANESYSRLFAWDYFPVINDVILHKFRHNFHGNRLYIFDNKKLFQSMKYGHIYSESMKVDCFHYCFPGPNYWQIIALNQLMQEIQL
eukprot:66224_1